MNKKEVKNKLCDECYGDLLLDEKFQGKLFVKGLFVGKLTDAKFGYNLKNLTLDRDRRVPSHYALEEEIGNLLGNLAEYNKIKFNIIEEILNEPSCLEARSCGSIWNMGFVDGFAEYISDKYGEDTILVSSIQEQTEAQHLGLKTVIVEPFLRKLIDRSDKKLNFENAKKKTLRKAKKFYNLDELSFEQDLNWHNAISLVEKFIPESFELKIVEFHSKNLMGLYCGGSKEILISFDLLNNPQELLITLIHEIAHTAGGDGSKEHLDRICKIFSGVIYK